MNAEERIATCTACPNKLFRLNFVMTCGVCGCPVQTKARVKSSTCPESRWGEEK